MPSQICFESSANKLLGCTMNYYMIYLRKLAPQL